MVCSAVTITKSYVRGYLPGFLISVKSDAFSYNHPPCVFRPLTFAGFIIITVARLVEKCIDGKYTNNVRVLGILINFVPRQKPIRKPQPTPRSCRLAIEGIS